MFSKTVNFQDTLDGIDNNQNIRIYDSDTIRVGKSNTKNMANYKKAILSDLNSKFIEVYVVGRVNSPGLIKVSKASTLNDAIDVAGGARVIKGKVRFLRFKRDGSLDNRKISYSRRWERGTLKNPTLKNGDVIVVGNSFLTNSTEVINELTAPVVGVLSTYGLIQVVRDRE